MLKHRKKPKNTKSPWRMQNQGMYNGSKRELDGRYLDLGARDPRTAVSIGRKPTREESGRRGSPRIVNPGKFYGAI